MGNDSNTLVGAGDEHLAFEVGAQNYAIDIGVVREIRGWTKPS